MASKRKEQLIAELEEIDEESKDDAPTNNSNWSVVCGRTTAKGVGI